MLGIQKNQGNIPDDLNNFDAEFFGYSDSEADDLDFQLRMLLEKTYEAILDSGNQTSFIVNSSS
jgi:acyl transferase domain-containing protein